MGFFFRSSDTTMNRNEQLMDILVPFIISVFITMIVVIAVVYCWRKRKYIFRNLLLIFKMILLFELLIRTDLIQ